MAVALVLPLGVGAESKAKSEDTETFDLKFPGGSPTELLAAIEAATKAGEATHSGQVRFVVEGALDGRPLFKNQPARERALDIFSQLRIWDTAHNNGVLIYLLLADHNVEIIADRGIDTKVGAAGWENICAGMEKVRFPKLDFRGVTTGNVLTALSMLDNGRSARWLANDQVWVLTAPPTNRRTQVFYVGNLLSQLKIDDITTAIQTTWQMARGGQLASADMKFHEETKLLIVLGESQQLESVSEVLGQLQNSISNSPGTTVSAPKSAKEPAPTVAPSAR